MFSFRKPRNSDVREVIVKIWMWHKDQKEKLEIPFSKMQEFYDSLYKTYIEDPKEEDSGSGSEDDGLVPLIVFIFMSFSQYRLFSLLPG